MARIDTENIFGTLSTVVNQDGELETWLFTESGLIEVDTPVLLAHQVAELYTADTLEGITIATERAVTLLNPHTELRGD